mmetsp:Transcript_19128/g.24125  ORF Transcript_19128/g.24125 Transcript_19128/m.24125 type:complete len:413 (+) Transcript_19128:124-1362(+)
MIMDCNKVYFKLKSSCSVNGWIVSILTLSALSYYHCLAFQRHPFWFSRIENEYPQCAKMTTYNSFEGHSSPFLSSQRLFSAPLNSPSSLKLLNQTDENFLIDDSRVPELYCACQDTRPNIHWIEASSGIDVDTSLTPVIILHGMFGSSRNFLGWAKTLPLMLKRPRQVFLVDLRNHGQSDWHESMTLEDLTCDVCGFMEELDIPKAIFIGHSIGGKIACNMALKKPRLVDGLMVLDIAPVTYNLEKDSQWREVVTNLQKLNQLPLATITSKQQADRLLMEAIPDDAKRAFCLQQLQPDPTTKRLRWVLNIKALADNVDHLGSFDTRDIEQQNAYHQEVLFVAGGKSRFLRSSHLPIIAALFPNFKLITIRDTGHWLHIDAAERTLELAKAYIERDGWKPGHKVGQKPFFYYS